MHSIQHILVGTDFSEASHAALDMAARIAEQNGAKVTVVHVYDPMIMVPPPNVNADSLRGFADDLNLEKSIQDALDQIHNEWFEKVENAATVLLHGTSAASEICSYAKNEKVDLICISTHGRTGLSHMLIGSVAEKVVRHAPCAVLVLPSTKK
jgi:universal stress protein A